MADAADAAGGGGAERPRLNLKKRDDAAAADLEKKAAAKAKSNPFGDAKPRESVLAKRDGVDEAAVLKKEAAAWKPRLRLTREQEEEQKAPEAELATKEAALAAMVKGFEDLAVKAAREGTGRRREYTEDGQGGRGGGQGGGEDYGSFGRREERGRDGEDYGSFGRREERGR